MTRRELREEIFKLLFMVEFYSKDEMKEQVKSYFEDFPEKEISEKDHAYIEEKYENICAVLPKIDEKIASAAKGWKLERISKTALAVMRCAICEILYMDDIPNAAAINEAVELDKGYDEPDTVAFVNGVLGGFMRGEFGQTVPAQEEPAQDEPDRE